MSSSNGAVKNGEQTAKPATRFTKNSPTDDATDSGPLTAYRIDSYFASYNAGIPSSRGQEPEAGPAAGLADLEALMAATAGGPTRPEI